MKATKKPVTIDAIYYNGSNAEEVLKFCEGNAVKNEDSSLTIHTLEGDHKAIVTDYIIRGVKGEYYPCKEDIFEKTYDVAENVEPVECVPYDNEYGFTHDFSWALRQMKNGKKIHRAGWNGKGMFAVLQKGYPNGIPCNKQTAEAWGLNEGDLFRCEPYMQLKMVNGSHSMWVPSVNDCLSNDWAIVEG